MSSYTFPTVSEALPILLRNLLSQGDEVGSRNGRVKEFLNTQITLTNPTRREVLSLNRKANVFAQIAETMWVLSGRNDVEWLSAYLPRAFDYADDGAHWRAGYGPRIRGTQQNGLDQLDRVIKMLQRDPLTRQAVIQIWDVTDGDIDLALKDRACNTQLQFQSRLGRLHLTVTVRSNDAMWGWSGINAFEWSTLQEIVASLLGIAVGPLTFNIGSLHLYEPHWEKASRIEWISEEFETIPFNPDHLVTSLDEVDRLLDRWFVWEGMCRTGEVTADLLEEWEEPLFKAWAAAIAYYWMREDEWLADLRGTALAGAIARTPASVLPEPVQRPLAGLVVVGPATTLNENVRAFYDFVKDLHAAKHASYGDSWKKRGEKLSILANIARKVDRLGVGDEFDSSADTMIDLWVYLAKYLCWLDGKSAGPDNVNLLLGWSLGETENLGSGAVGDIENISKDLDYYMDNIDALTPALKGDFVRVMLKRVAPYARDLWLSEQVDKIHGPGASDAIDKAYEDGTIFSDNYRGADVD